LLTTFPLLTNVEKSAHAAFCEHCQRTISLHVSHGHGPLNIVLIEPCFSVKASQSTCNDGSTAAIVACPLDQRPKPRFLQRYFGLGFLHEMVESIDPQVR
jgi:hypothetical protein